MIGRIAGRIEYRGDGSCADRRARRRLYRLLLGPHACGAARRRREGGALYRSAGARGSAAAFRLHDAGGKGMAPPADDGAGRRRQGSLAILGTLGPDGVSRAIALGDWNAVKAAKGIGPKIAQRVVNELKDKAPGGHGDGRQAVAPARCAGRGRRGDRTAAPRTGTRRRHGQRRRPRPRRCRPSAIWATRPARPQAPWRRRQAICPRPEPRT